MNLFKRFKASQRPDAVSMSESEHETAIANATMDRYDILDFLNGENVQLIDGETEELEACAYEEIIAGLELYRQQVQEHGQNDYIKSLQRESKFDAFESAASQLVAGFDISLSKIKSMPENVLRQWLIRYIEQLARAKRKTEKSIVFTCQHNGIGW